MANKTEQRTWKVHPNGNELMIVESGHHVASVPLFSKIDEPEDRANARLIAAAPDLYAALRELLKEYRLATMSDGADVDGPDQREEVIKARAALAKVNK